MANTLLEPDDERLFQQLLLNGAPEDGGPASAADSPSYRVITPQAGFCLKTKTEKGDKIFINVCTAENIPVPREVSDEEVLALLDSEDPSHFRVPMSLGEPHAEVDNSNQGCTAYDVVINPEFYERTQKSEVLLGFFLTIVLEGLEYKNNISLCREWKIMKNRKFLGALPEQNVRTQSKPWIMDMDNGQTNSGGKLISEVTPSDTPPTKARAPEPIYTIIQEPSEGYPEFLIAEVQLPKLKTAAGFTLDIGEDRLLIETRANTYHLDVYLPYNLIQEECGAQFNRKTKILTLTMPVQPAS